MQDTVDLDYLQESPTANIEDRQHAEIKRMRQNLRTAIVEGMGMAQIVACAKNLVDTTIAHFTSEENAMEVSKFSGLGEHRLLHAEMLESVKKIWSDLKLRKIGDALALVTFFDVRLTYHMECEDIAFGRELRNRNPTETTSRSV
jgi:hemerythrin-like metal-binding protein